MIMEIVQPIFPYLVGAVVIGFILGWIYCSQTQ